MKKVNPTCWFHCWITTFLIVEYHWKPQNCPLHSFRPFSAKSSIKFVENFHRSMYFDEFLMDARLFVFITCIVMETKHTKNSSNHCLFPLFLLLLYQKRNYLLLIHRSVRRMARFVFRKLFWKFSADQACASVR